MLHAREDYNRRIQDSENLIPEDEPVFLFRAQDMLAIHALREYINVCKHNDVQPDLIRRVEEHIARFDEWALLNPVKSPDV